jgi:hypothetical protein
MQLKETKRGNNSRMNFICFYFIIGNRSGNISFQNRIDFLYDLQILDTKDYDDLKLLSEIRNQFMHNIECNSFMYLFCETGLKEKKNKFLKNNSRTALVLDEAYYHETFIKFTELVHSIVQSASEKVRIGKAENSVQTVEKFYDSVFKEVLSKIVEDQVDRLKNVFNPPDEDLERHKAILSSSYHLIYLTLLKQYKEDKLNHK